MTNLRVAVVAAALLFCQAAIAGEIFPYEDPATGTKTYMLKQGSTVVRFSPTIGANVFSIEVAGIEYLTTPPDMHDFLGFAYGTPILYPTPNRVRYARFMFEGREYVQTPNLPPDSIHGLVFDANWTVIEEEITDDSATVRVALDFKAGSRHFQGFPFPHRIVLTIKVGAETVRWTYEVDNSAGTDPVPFGFGLHPYFAYQGTRENTLVTIPASHMMEAVDFFPTGRLIPAEELAFPLGEPIKLQGKRFDDVFWGLRSTEPVLVDFPANDRKITMTASESFSHVVLYTPEHDVFSIEHQTSSTDAHNLHAAGNVDAASLEICPPGETCSGWVEYRFQSVGDVEWVFEDGGFELSQEHCQSCHGFAFTGARTATLWNDDWQHAETAADISRVISDGIPGTGMPAFADILNDSQVESLTVLMVELLQNYPRDMVRIALEVSHGEARISFRETYRLETIVDGLNIPWSMAFLPDERILVSERDGFLRLVDGPNLSAPITGTPRVWSRQDGGLLALALDPEFDQNSWIYLSYSEPGDSPASSMTKIVRGRIAGLAWVDEEVVWQSPANFYTDSNSHYGTRLLFDNDYLYFSVGDRGQRESTQDLSNPTGKIHRIHRDGSIPADNPFVGRAGAYPSIWSLGHRNPQGLALSDDGELWSAEHGPTGGDELNRIQAAHNYGWPLATDGVDLDGSQISAHRSLPGMADPVHVWPESIAPSSIAFYDGDKFPDWRGSLFVASLREQELRRIEIKDGEIVAQELLLKGVGRIRDVQTGPDGFVYIAVERYGGQGGVLRLVPASLP